MHDYKSRLCDQPSRKRKQSRLPLIALVFGPLVATGLFGFGTQQTGTTQDLSVVTSPDQTPKADVLAAQVSVELEIPNPEGGSLNAPISEPVAHPSPELSWQTLKVKKGDTLAGLFHRHGLSAAELQQLMRLGEPAVELTRIFPGDDIQMAVDEKGRLQRLVYEKEPTRILRIERGMEGFSAELVEKTYEKRLTRARGTIEDSLFTAATQSGLSNRLTMELAAIFGWDIDFALDIRSGDQFSLVYEELFLDGEKVDDGRIVAAEFINQGRQVQAVLFTKPDGVSDYYSPEGHSMRKAFLRSPVDFRRISSRFQGERWHPVLGKKRPHRGVDYAASVGTPIKAAGDGKVVFAGVKGGYGRTVILQHGQSYSTLYAHMSRIARGVRSGKRLQQGQVIGYVGRTGLATGPHLHYEFQVNGVHRNPLTVKLPQAQPLEREYHEAFQQQVDQLMAQLNLIRRFSVAEVSFKP